MRISLGHRFALTGSAVALGLVFLGTAHAQDATQGNVGIVVGEVDRCTDGNDVPVLGSSVGIQTDTGVAQMASTDSMGQFSLSLPAGQYTVVASAEDGSSASRQYVPVSVGESVDIGALELNAGPLGCGVSLGDLTANPTATPTGS